ncbi:MAG: NAD(P)/FAD-dependent oxidoreductase [Candidatus Bathyarchaeia archaeon]
MKTDVVVIGAGPAGLFAARELALRSKLRILVVDRGYNVGKRVCPINTYKMCSMCSPCHILCGAGGAGTLSSGLLNLRPDIGGNLVELLGSKKRAWDAVRYVDAAFVEYGAPKKIYEPKDSEAKALERKAASAGVRFLPIPQRMIGTDNAPRVIENFIADLKGRGVRFLFNKKVERIGPGTVGLAGNSSINCRYIIAAPGRVGASWLAGEAKRLGIQAHYSPIDIGVRVEVPSIIMESICETSLDPKFHVHTRTYDDFVRTFCTNHHGFVVQEVYDGFVGVNGHTFARKKSENTNFALLVRVELTHPLENTTLYGETIATQMTTLGGGKPLIQRLGDLAGGRRSTWDRIKKSLLDPTLMSVTPGDIAMGMPHRIVSDIMEGLERLDKVISGVASSSTLLYAPEVKFSASLLKVDRDLQTTIDNIFVAGDGAGLSGGLVQAAATGIIAARGILKREGRTLD